MVAFCLCGFCDNILVRFNPKSWKLRLSPIETLTWQFFGTCRLWILKTVYHGPPEVFQNRCSLNQPLGASVGNPKVPQMSAKSLKIDTWAQLRSWLCRFWGSVVSTSFQTVSDLASEMFQKGFWLHCPPWSPARTSKVSRTVAKPLLKCWLQLLEIWQRWNSIFNDF